MLPERLHLRINRMVGHQWLESCKNRQRMEQTLLMLSKRASFENNIPEAMIPYDLNAQCMDRLFADFFEDVQKHISLQNAN
jgi:acyl carrier protein phosphodiesterase